MKQQSNSMSHCTFRPCPARKRRRWRGRTERLAKGLDSFPASREVIVLRKLEGCSYKESHPSRLCHWHRDVHPCQGARAAPAIARSLWKTKEAVHDL